MFLNYEAAGITEVAVRGPNKGRGLTLVYSHTLQAVAITLIFSAFFVFVLKEVISHKVTISNRYLLHLYKNGSTATWQDAWQDDQISQATLAAVSTWMGDQFWIICRSCRNGRKFDPGAQQN